VAFYAPLHRQNRQKVILPFPVTRQRIRNVTGAKEEQKEGVSDTGNRTRALPALYSELTLRDESGKS
jgi:hypothetical protein